MPAAGSPSDRPIALPTPLASPGSGGAPSSRPAVALSPGRSLVVPEGSRYDTTNVGAGAARLLVATFAVPQAPGGATLVPDALPFDVTAETLAGGLATEVRPGPAILSLERAALARNARLSAAGTEGPTLVFSEAGRLSVAATGGGWVRRGADGMSVAADEAVLAAGDGALLHPGGLAALWNADDGPAVALVVTLRPVAGAMAPAAPRGYSEGQGA